MSKFFRAVALVDVDQVCANLYPEWLGRYNRDYNDTLHQNQITSWGMQDFVVPACGEKIFRYLDDRTLYDNVQPVQGALEGVNLLRSLDVRVVFVTSMLTKIAGRKAHWLHDHGFLTLAHGNYTRDFIEAADKSLIRGDFMVDDYYGNLRDFQGVKILFDECHNQESPLLQAAGMSPDYHRAHGWPEVVSHITHHLVQTTA